VQRVLVLAIVILYVSVCLFVRLSRPRTDSSPGERDSGFFSHDSVESLVFSVTKFGAAAWGDSFRTRASKRGTPLRNRYFTTINSSSVSGCR